MSYQTPRLPRSRSILIILDTNGITIQVFIHFLCEILWSLQSSSSTMGTCPDISLHRDTIGDREKVVVSSH